MTTASNPPGPSSEPILRPIRPADDPALAHVIRTVMTEFGAVGRGFSIEDAEVDGMFAAYDERRAAYFVVERDGAVLGGAGIAPLVGAEADVCELKKMYLLPEGRGLGMGRLLLDHCLEVARERGYRRCYLETLSTMSAAQALYRKAGFEPIQAPLGATGHFGCDRWYARSLVAV